MPCIAGKENVFNWMRMNKAPYWNLCSSTAQGSRITQSSDEPDLSLEQSIKKLSDFFDITGNQGRYFLITKNSPTATSAGVFKSMIELNGLSQAQPAGFTPQSFDESVFDRKIAEQRKIWDLEHQVKELKESKGPPPWAQKLIEACAPHIPGMLGLGSSQTIGIAGVNLDSSQTQQLPDKQADQNQTLSQEQANTLRLQKALERLDIVLAANGFNIITELEKLAGIAEANPKKIVGLLSML